MRTAKQVQADIEEAKNTPVDEWVRRLERARDGANVHYVNKAIFYLNYFSEVGKDKRYIHDGKYDRLMMLIDAIICTLRDKDWSALGRHMQGWF